MIILTVVGIIILLFFNRWLSNKIDDYLSNSSWFYGDNHELIYIVLCIIEIAIIIQVIYSSSHK